MNKSVYLGLSILELSKILMHEFWYDYVKLKYYLKKTKLGNIDTDSFTAYKKADDIYKDIAVRLGTSNYELHRPLSKIKK